MAIYTSNNSTDLIVRGVWNIKPRAIPRWLVGIVEYGRESHKF